MGSTAGFNPAKFDALLTVSALMASGNIDVFALIGTHKDAGAVKELHPRPHRLRAVLGLDAKNPGIVLPEVDLDNAVNKTVTGSLSFNGQSCTVLKILFVREQMVDSFLEKFNRILASLKGRHALGTQRVAGATAGARQDRLPERSGGRCGC